VIITIFAAFRDTLATTYANIYSLIISKYQELSQCKCNSMKAGDIKILHARDPET